MASAAGIVIEVAEDGRHLSLDRGFMVVSTRGSEIGRVPLDDIAVLIATAHGLTFALPSPGGRIRALGRGLNGRQE